MGLAVVLAGLLSGGNLRAEGSKELCANGGYRPWLMYRNDTSDGSPITNRTVINVYARTNETINLGSSVRTASKIIWYAPNGVIGTNAITGGVGIISNRTQEVAGPLPNIGGYNPRTITVSAAQTGVWEIHFISPDPTSGDNPSSIVATNNWTQPVSGGQVAAWDVTVRTSGGTAIPGRVYANLISMSMGDWVTGGTLRSQVYYLTADGYRYRINLNSVDPFRFQFFANNRGFRDGSGEPLFKSVTLAGASVKNPLTPDTATDITHKLFFNSPAGDLPNSAATRSGTTWLNSTPTTVITSNIRFIGLDGTTNQVGSALGGNFTFDATGPGSYIINIDLTGDGAYTSAVDRVLLGTAYAGTNTVFWDGRDGQGNPAPGGQSIFNSKVAVANGEVHFPFADAEGCYSGIVIERLNGPTNDTFTIYWDDTNFASGTKALPPIGSNSVAGAHAWLPSGNSGFGNARGIDTWVFVPGDYEQPSSPIVIKQTDLEVVSQTRTPTFVKPTTNVTYTVVIRNNGPDNTPQARFLNSFPPGLTNLTLLSSVFSGSAGITSGAFSNGTYDAEIHMNVSELGTLTFGGTVSAGLGSVLTNLSQFLTYNDIGDVNDPDRVGAGNNSITNIVAVTFSVAGFAYNDANLNATRDGGENGTGLGSLYAKLINTNSPATAVQAALVDPSTGAYTLTTTSTGGYQVILDDNSTLADVTPALPAGWLGTEAVGQRRTGVTVNNDVSGINFGLYNSSYLLLSTLANPTVRTSAGSITMSVIVTNTSSISNALTAVVNNLPNVPGAATYVTGTSLYNGNAIGNPTIVSVTNLTWNGTFAVPAGGVGTLTFAINLPASLGVYTNRTFARVSNTQIDTTASTADNAPAIETARRSAAPNNAPTVQNVVTSVNMGNNVVVNPSAADADSDPLTLFIVTPPANGSVIVNGNLTFTYTPSITYFGPDSFTYRATDGTSNSVLGTASITVLDVTAPVIGTCATNITGNANASCQGSVPNFTASVIATDNSGVAPTITQSPVFGALVGSGTNTVTIFAVDGSANTNTCTASFIVRDVTPPVINTCATNILANANASCQATVPSFTNGVVATDSCGGAVALTQVPTIGTTVGTGTNSITIRAVDLAGNTNTCTASFIVRDATPPVINTCATNILANADASCQAIVPNFTNVVVATDNCGGAIAITQVPTIGSTVGSGTNTITIRAVDLAGNTNTCTASFIVRDVTAPTVNTFATNITASVNASCQAAVPNFTNAVVAVDNCSGVLAITQSPTIGTLVGIGTNTVTLNVFDVAGNTNTSTAAFIVSDTTAPTITQCATNLQASADGTGNAAVPDFTTGVATSDNCTGVVAVTQSPLLGALVGLGAHTITIAAVDTAGNTNTCTATFTVNDTSAPDIITCAANQSAQVGTNCQAVVPDFTAGVTATDNSGVAPTITQSPLAGSLIGVGTNAITLTATDGSSNSVQCTANLIVTDTIAPTITCPAAVNLVAPPGTNSVSGVNLGTPVTADNCGVASVTNDAPPLFFVGVTTVTWTVTDNSGNPATCEQTVTIQAINHAPVAIADIYTNSQNSALLVSVPGLLANDSDPDGDPIFAVIVAPPTNGLVTVNADGSFEYTPNVNFVGTDSFSYKATDGNLNSSNAVISIVVEPVNQAATANPDSFSTPSNTTLTVTAPGVLANDTDPEGGAMTAVLVTDVAHGTLTLNPDGSFEYIPASGYIGFDSFTYAANDGGTDSAPVLVTLAVGLGNVPVANPDNYTLDQNEPLTVALVDGVLANDTSANPLTAFVVSGPQHGTLDFNADGTFTYTPDANYSGTDSFVYRATDGTLVSGAAIVTFTVNFIDQPPVANPDSYSATPDGVLTVDVLTGVLANDYDPEGLPLTAVLVDDVTSGVLVLNADGSFQYTPDISFVGADSFTYTATDGVTNSAPVTVSINVDASNTVPVANNDSFDTNKNAPLNVPAPGVLANDYDGDGNPLTAALVTGPAHGALTFNADGSFVYTPTNGFSGADSFTYKLNDGTADSGVANVFLTINNVILTPTVQSSTPTASSGTTLTVPAPGALTGSTAPNSLPLVALLVTNVANGTLVLNGDGSYSYTPDANFLGEDCFTFAGTDGLATSAMATVCITVVDASAPVITACASNQTLSAGASCQVALPNLTGNLTVTDNSGTFTVTQSPVAATALNLGTNTITLIAADDAGNSSTCTATVVVLDTTAPVITLAGDSVMTVGCQGSFSDPGATATDICAGTLTGSINVTGAVNVNAVGSYTLFYNVTDPAGNAATEVTRTVNVVDTTAPSITCPGTVIVTAPVGSNSVTGVSLGSPGTSDNCGTVSVGNDAPGSFPLGVTIVTWTADDGNGNTNTCQQTVTVLAGNTPPVATDGTIDAPQDGQLIIPAPGVLTFASDADNDALSAIKITDPAHGTLTLLPDGSFTYTPDAGYVGTDTFTYAVNDGQVQSGTATITIIVNAVGTVTDLELLAGSASFTKSWVKPNRDRLRLKGRVNPRGARADLTGATMLISVNGTNVAAPVLLDAKGRGSVTIGQSKVKAYLSSRNGKFKFNLSRVDLAGLLSLTNTTASGMLNLDIVLTITDGDFDIPQIGGVFETPYRSKSGKGSKGRFKFKSHRTLTGVFNSNKTTAKLGKANGYSVSFKGAIENVNDAPIIPTGPIRIQVGNNLIEVPLAAVNGKVKVPGLKKFRLKSAKHTFQFTTTELSATDLPPPGTDGETSYRLPMLIQIPTGTTTNTFETIIELKRKGSTGKSWKR